jgi:hypothetical protein
MFRDKKFIIAITAAILLIVFIGVSRPRQIDWASSFSSEDRIPYGTYVFYNSLSDIFDKKEVGINTKSLYYLLHKKNFSNTSLIFIQNDFDPAVKDRKDLLAFAAQGNNVFISTGHIHRGLADVLKISERRAFFRPVMANSKEKDNAAYSETNFTNPALHSDSTYLFKKNFYAAFYDVSDSILNPQTQTTTEQASEITVLGTDVANRPTFIRIKYGKGYVFLHNNPYAFTNYYMLKPRGDEYVAKCLSYLPKGRVILDEASKKQHEAVVKTPLVFILTSEPLRWAYFVTITFLLLFVLFNVKRRQRIIPIIEPFKNASLEFTQTIGSLYFNQSNHKNIAKKKITYFLEFIRNRYNIDTSNLDEEFARRLGYKSGMSDSAMEHLLSIITGIEKKIRISDTELIDLNHALEYFKHNCQ